MNPILVLEDLNDALSTELHNLLCTEVPEFAEGDLAGVRESLRRTRLEVERLIGELERGPEPVQVDFVTCPKCGGGGEVRHLLFWQRECPNGCVYGRVRA